MLKFFKTWRVLRNKTIRLSRKRRSPRARLTFDHLDDRILPSVTVNLNQAGILAIVADANSNAVQVTPVDPNQVRGH
jgi:hypothetical protein